MLPTMQQGTLGAEAALHTGEGLAVPAGLGTMVMAGGRTHGATGLVDLASLTLQSWGERRAAWSRWLEGTRIQQQQASEPKLIHTGRGGGHGVDSRRAPPKAVCNMKVLQESKLSMLGSSRRVCAPHIFALESIQGLPAGQEEHQGGAEGTVGLGTGDQG